jgi:hypothetical protein
MRLMQGRLSVNDLRVWLSLDGIERACLATALAG